MHGANEDLQTLKACRHNRMIPAHVIGAAHDATIEVHLLVAPVTVHTTCIPSFGRGEERTALVLQRRNTLCAPAKSIGLAGCDGHPPAGKICRTLPWHE
eukprot:930211-Amphidinium_carterae.1